jgi:hypothetical protein
MRERVAIPVNLLQRQLAIWRVSNGSNSARLVKVPAGSVPLRSADIDRYSSQIAELSKRYGEQLFLFKGCWQRVILEFRESDS